MSAPSRPGAHDPEAISEQSRVVRSRALRLNTLHQRAYHNDELSPLSNVALDGFGTRTESQGSDKSSTSALSEKDQLLLGVGGSPQNQIGASSTKTRFYLHRRLSSPERLLPVAILKRLRNSLPRSLSRRLPSIYRRVSALGDSPSLWLSLYFILNLTLTLYNKTVLIHFPFPYTLTALHAFCGTVGTSVLLRMNPGIGIGGTNSFMGGKGARSLNAVSPSSSSYQSVPNLNGKELLVLFLFSILYTLNIIVSNASLRLVTVPVSTILFYSVVFP